MTLIRPAVPGDARAIARLFTAMGHPATAEDVAQRWQQWAAAGNSALVAVSLDDTVLGAATLHRMDVLHRPRAVGRVTALVVDAPERGKGIGRALLAAAEAVLTESGCGMLEITSNVRFTEAHGFYRHLGYEQTSLRFAKVLNRGLRTLAIMAATLITHTATASPALSNAVGIVESVTFIPPPNRPGKSGYIELVHQRQETNLCVPTSASIVLAHLGRPTTPRELKTLARGRRYDPAKKFTDFTLTLFPDLVSGVSSLGFPWRLGSYANSPKGAKTGLADIARSIDRGLPVLIDTSLYRGHTFVVNGYDDDARELFVIDPNIPAPGIRVLGYEDVERIWNSRGVGSNARGAVFTTGRQEDTNGR